MIQWYTSLHQPLLGIVAAVELEGEDVLHELVDVPRLGHDLEVLPVIETAVVEGDQEVAGYVGVRLLWSGQDIQLNLRIVTTKFSVFQRLSHICNICSWKSQATGQLQYVQTSLRNCQSNLLQNPANEVMDHAVQGCPTGFYTGNGSLLV